MVPIQEKSSGSKNRLMNDGSNFSPAAVQAISTKPSDNGGTRSNQQHELRDACPPASSRSHLQNGMRAAAIDEGGNLPQNHHVSISPRDEERFDHYDQQALPTMQYQYFQQQQDLPDVTETGPDHLENMQQDQCPSSDIVADAAQEFERQVHRKQQAKSAKHQAERTAWQKNLQQELQAKQVLQDRFDVLQQEKTELAAAIVKRKAKITGFEATANRFKTFVGGLANDMAGLKRDASNHRRNCEDIAGEAQEHKEVLDTLLQQLSGNAEKSSRLKNEAIKACHSANAQLSTASLRGSHLEEQLKEKSLQLTEEKSRREEVQSQLSSDKESRDATLRLFKSSEQTILDKLSELATSLAGVDDGNAITEQLSKTLKAVQGLNSQQTTTVNDIAAVKGIVEQLSERLAMFCFASSKHSLTSLTALTNLLTMGSNKPTVTLHLRFTSTKP